MRRPALLAVIAAVAAGCGSAGGSDEVAGTTIPHPPPVTSPAPAADEPPLRHEELADRLDAICRRAADVVADALADAQQQGSLTPHAARELRARVARRLRPALRLRAASAEDRAALGAFARAVRRLDAVDDRAAAERREALRERARAATALDAPSCAAG